jgi:hypothetical protein
VSTDDADDAVVDEVGGEVDGIGLAVHNSGTSVSLPDEFLSTGAYGFS